MNNEYLTDEELDLSLEDDLGLHPYMAECLRRRGIVTLGDWLADGGFRKKAKKSDLEVCEIGRMCSKIAKQDPELYKKLSSSVRKY